MSVSAVAAGDPSQDLPIFFSWRLPERASAEMPIEDAFPPIRDIDDERILSLFRNGVPPAQSFKVDFGLEPGPPTAPQGAIGVWHFGPVDPDRIKELSQLIKQWNEDDPALQAALGASLPMVPAEMWSPAEASSLYLGTTPLGLGQIRAARAHAESAKGKGVVVVIVDQGINKDVLQKRHPGAKFDGGWSVQDGTNNWIRPGGWPDGHGTRMAELVLSVAPEATILDLPLLPPRIRDFRGFLDWATWIYSSLPATIDWAKSLPHVNTFKGPWVICNAWSIYDLTQDFTNNFPQWSYGKNPNAVLSKSVADLANSGLADIVFAAGNNGQFAPDPRSAPRQIGPGRSIYGVTALPEVLTVGAVRNDEIWLGYSAQGPAPASFCAQKPDLVAPSQFTAPSDAARGYTGTSASCALAAGALAAVRSKYPGPTPAILLDRVVTRARELLDPTPKPICVGKGMLDLERILFENNGTPWNGQPNPTGTPTA